MFDQTRLVACHSTINVCVYCLFVCRTASFDSVLKVSNQLVWFVDLFVVVVVV